MATNFPTSLDSLTNPATSDQLNSPSHALQHTNANDAIEALEAKVGVDGSTVTTSHAYKIAQLESDIQNSAGDFIPLSVLGQPSGPAELDADGNLIVPENKIIIEGATADAHELTIQAPDVASDITVTLPNAAGTLALTSDITTAVNNLVNSAPNTLDTLNELATALGNDANFATTTATSIGNKVSKAGGDIIQSSLSSVIPLVLKGAASQTANLQEWQDSAGNLLGRITSTGITSFYGGSNIFSGDVRAGTSSYLVAALSVAARVATESGLVVRGFASQTANLQEWQNSAGTVYATISPYGQLSIGLSPTIYGNSRISINTVAATAVGQVIRGVASQTANLQEWQDSAGTVLANVSSSGQFLTPRLTITNGGNIVDSAGTTPYFGFGSNQISLLTRNAAYKGLVIQGSASQTADLQQWQNSAGTALVTVSPSGFINTSSGIGTATTSYMNGIADSAGSKMVLSFNSTLYGLLLTNIQAAGVGFIVKGAASQSANLQEWQDSAGSALSYIKSDGSLHFTANSNAVLVSGTATSGLNRIISNGNDFAFSPYFDGLFAPANSGGRWRPANDATSDLGSSGQRWKDLYATSGTLTNNSTSKVGLIVKAIASQTANLMEFQNSSGVPVTFFNASGGLTATEGVISTAYSGGKMTTGTLGYFNATTFNAAVSPIIVRGAASQTANLQEWQGSTGTVAAKVSSNGAISSISGGFFGTASGPIDAGNYLAVRPWAANHIPFTVKGFAAQTGDLTRWLDDAGTVLAKIDSTGAMFTTTAAANTNTTQVATTAYVQTELADLVNSAPATLDTLKELSDALGADANFATTVTNNLALKAPLASPALTGTPTAPTAAVGTDSTQVATTAFVIDQIDASTQPGALYQTTAPTSPEIGQIWIDSDDNVTVFDSNIIRRQPFTATAGQTNFVTTVPFIDGFEQVYFNGLLLLKTTDYTTSGTNTVILGSAAAVNDIIEVVTITNLNSVNTYTQAETDALLAANTSVAPLSISANTNILAKKRYFVTSASALTLTLPASPALNDEIQILDASGNASTYNITVARNGRLINGNAGNLIIDNNGGWYTLVYTGATYGWKVG